MTGASRSDSSVIRQGWPTPSSEEHISAMPISNPTVPAITRLHCRGSEIPEVPELTSSYNNGRVAVPLTLGAQLVPRGMRQWLAVLLSAIVGWVTWTAVVASQPRYSLVGNRYIDTDDSWSGRLLVLLMGFALVGGFVAYRCSGAVALALAVPGVLSSPFTTPRGDEDGLWTLMIPMMVGLAGVMVLLAWGAAAVRVKVDSRLSMASSGRWVTDPSGRHQLRYFDGRIWTGHVLDDGRHGYDPPT